MNINDLDPEALRVAREAHDKAARFWQEHYDGYPLHLMPNVIGETVKAYLDFMEKKNVGKANG